MTAYHGGKQRIGARIADIILQIYEDAASNGARIQGYCEPFCGMCGVYKHVPARLNAKLEYLAGDINKSLIIMWNSLKKGWRPPTTCTVSEYNKLKQSKAASALAGFVGHAYSYRGRYFGTYFRDNKNYVHTVADIAALLKSVKFTHGQYEQFGHLTNYIIYCDPPYKNTDHRYSDGTKTTHFNHDAFWKWCTKMARNNIVLVSEYTIPKNINNTCIFRYGREHLYLILPN